MFVDKLLHLFLFSLLLVVHFLLARILLVSHGFIRGVIARVRGELLIRHRQDVGTYGVEE